MPLRYQDIYPTRPLVASSERARASAADLLTLEYFEAEPGSMPEAVFAQHHVLLNLREGPHRVENWRDGVHRDFTLLQHEIIVTPAGIRSGWRWHARSQVIIITLEPEKLESFALSEVGTVLTGRQLRDLPQFADEDICQAGLMLKEALDDGIGSAVLFESLARVFLVKLIRKYGEVPTERELAFQRGFTARHYQRVLDFVAARFGESISVEELATEAGISPSHFARLFRAVIGQTPMQFVTSYRVEQAKRFLARQDMPMVEIAMSCGFADQAHFSRVFKQLEGATPKRFRAALLGAAS